MRASSALWILWTLTWASADGGRPAPVAPCQGRVRPRELSIRFLPDASAAVIGAAHRGAILDVISCTPRCDDPAGWARLAPEGAVRLSQVDLVADASQPLPSDFLYRWAGSDAGLPVFTRPSTKAPILETLETPRVVALELDAALPVGWGRHAEANGFIRWREVANAEVASRLRGERDPELPLAFNYRLPSTGDGGLPRYWRGHLVGENGRWVTFDGGTTPRSTVRIARWHPAPPAVSDGGFWVHVDPREQVLVAYEGDLPVFATLVSTGIAGHETLPGLYPVWFKARHERMHGEGYFVEEVPDVLYFDRSQGLHGAFWHDRFGWPASHGCVNLSMSDATWLFEWAPPPLPAGWHTWFPLRAAEPTLWVLVGPNLPADAGQPISTAQRTQ